MERLRAKAQEAQTNLGDALASVSAGSDVAEHVELARSHIGASLERTGIAANRLGALAVDHIYLAESFLQHVVEVFKTARNSCHDVLVLLVCRVTNPFDDESMLRAFNNAFRRQIDQTMLSRLRNANRNVQGLA